MALTEWHFVLLYEDRVCAVDLLTDKVVYNEPLDLVRSPFPLSLISSRELTFSKLEPKPPASRPIRLATDPLRRTCWMHTESAIYELVIRDEDRDVWRVYLARGNWDAAKRAAKVRRARLVSPFTSRPTFGGGG